MIRPKASPAQLQRLLDRAKSVRPVSPGVRARVLERARESTVFGALVWSNGQPRAGRFPRLFWWAAAAAALGLSGIAIALTQTRSAPPGPVPVSIRTSARVADWPRQPAVPSAVPSVSPAQLTSAAPAAPRAMQLATSSDSYRAELELLRGAQRAYATKDFDNALRLLGEHAARFANGRLAEEREALRVRALRASGRAEGARAAAHAFAAAFPHSVLRSRTLAAGDADADE